MSEFIICLIPIVAIVMIFGTGMLSIYFNYRRRKDMFALYHQERMAAIEKGIELPPLPEDFFHEDRKPPRRSGHGSLLGGLILVFVGVTLFLALHFCMPRMDDGSDPSVLALVPAAIGGACLIYYFMVGRRLAALLAEERKARLADAKATAARPNIPTSL